MGRSYYKVAGPFAICLLDGDPPAVLRDGAMARTIPSAILLALLCAGCRKATPEQCKPACEHLAGIQLEKLKGAEFKRVHEIDEAVDRAEEFEESTVKRLEAELKQGGPAWDEKAVAKLPAKKRIAVTARHREEAALLEQQRKAGIESAHKVVADARAKYAAAQKDSAEKLKKATQEAISACTETCVKRAPDHAECLSRVQALEDLSFCGDPVPVSKGL